ncbi:DUF2199 domain-containing protein [Rhizobium sullae]|uniref:DUF2199 domain-containing protein n=1 Tax=Rhizobium sullae TaxID=50338 RepID=A0A2N0D7T5_RHISU|nr:DUF2199 domain-containing protein [Rhizobium sullae]PKA42158.1 DUF2199 domain-containing protein [Rhizobium sullae]
MDESFICAICGTQHDGLTTDWAFKLPDVVWSIPEDERSEKAKFDSDLCQFGERYFMRCILYAPFRDRPSEFGWGLWAEVEWPTFKRYLELYEADGSTEAAYEGSLANALDAYPESFGAAVEIHFRGPSERPTLHLKSDDPSRFAEEQRRGISDTRYHEILKLITPVR